MHSGAWSTIASTGSRHVAWPQRYGAAVVVTVAVTLVARELESFWDITLQHPYLVEWPTIIVAAWLGGRGPGLVATTLSTVGILFYWVEPARSLRASHPSDLVALALYALLGVVMSVLIDRLHRARAEERRLRRSREMVLGVVAHDLRNSLNTIAAATSLLPRRPGDAHRIDVIARAASRMDRLIGDLVDASVLENNAELTMVFADEDVDTIVEEAITASTVEAARKGVRIAAEPGTRLRARCDRGRMLQVLGNLLSNAVKFTPEAGCVTVRAVHLGSFVRIEVSDTGPGIKPEQEGNVFDRNWTGGATGAGAGLGLFIARGIVRGHGGQIWLHSSGGHGTTFFLTVPAAAGCSDRPQTALGHIHLA
jgi:signal transduction histidine kinase